MSGCCSRSEPPRLSSRHQRPNLILVAYDDLYRLSAYAVITDSEGRVLLLKSAYGDLTWHLPGAQSIPERRFRSAWSVSAGKSWARKSMCSVLLVFIIIRFIIRMRSSFGRSFVPGPSCSVQSTRTSISSCLLDCHS
jgi:hypothetical protein